MGFWSNVFIAILSAINPALSFIGSIVKGIVSDAKNAGQIFVLDLISNIIPGGLAKDLALGMVSDAFEVFSLSEAVEQTVPNNNIVLKCDNCNIFTHFYVKNNDEILCSNCLNKEIDKRINSNDRIFIFKNGICRVNNKLKTFNVNSLSEKYSDIHSNINFKSPNLSKKYFDFRKIF